MKYKLYINREIFDYHEDGELCWISHPKWSLAGFGDNLQEALNDFKKSATIISPSFLFEDESKFSAEAIKLKKFLSNFL